MNREKQKAIFLDGKFFKPRSCCRETICIKGMEGHCHDEESK